MAFEEINWQDMKRFFEERGYQESRPNGWGEITFIKLYNDKNIAIVFGSTFDKRGMRARGKDAIRCLLMRITDGKILMQLKRVDRRAGMWDRIQLRITLSEELLKTGGACPRCSGYMEPKTTANLTRMFWGCAAFFKTHCSGSRNINFDLQKRIFILLKKPSRR